MTSEDFDKFAAMLDDVAALLQREYTGAQKAMFFRALAKYPLDQVRAGFDAHIKDPKAGMFMPMPAHIIGRIEGLIADDGRPGDEEAWAICIKAVDEAETVVWTDEMAQAWDIARTVIERGDEVGARMAFKDAYGRLVGQARKRLRPAAWTASLGHDPERRTLALTAAAQAGRIDVNDYPQLEAPRAPLLIEGPDDSPLKQAAVQSLLELRAKLEAVQMAPSHDAAARQRTAELQRELEARVSEYADTHGGAMNVDELTALAMERKEADRAQR
jgi:hypothetical protein